MDCSDLSPVILSTQKRQIDVRFPIICSEIARLTIIQGVDVLGIGILGER